MLSLILSTANGAAKHLDAHPQRPLTAFRVTRGDCSNGQVLFLTIEPCLNNIKEKKLVSPKASCSFLAHQMMLSVPSSPGAPYGSLEPLLCRGAQAPASVL